MGRKSSSKGQPPSSIETPAPKRAFTSVLVVALAALVLVLGGLAFWWHNDQVSQEVAAQAATPAVAEVPEVAKRPHPQKNLPALDFPAYPMGRPPEVVRAAYQFAAEHPEILSYVPCFCGYERAGHRGNEDCFVKARNAQGDVTERDAHGLDCTVCLDVANEAMQMHCSGASVRDIRAAIEKKWASPSSFFTTTPQPPAATK